MLNLCSVVSLIIVSDESNHLAVFCKLYDRVRSIPRYVVMGKDGVEEWAHDDNDDIKKQQWQAAICQVYKSSIRLDKDGGAGGNTVSNICYKIRLI